MTKRARSASGADTRSSRSVRTTLVVLANVLRILKAPEIAEAGLGVLCYHPTESGATWFWVDEGIDTGPIAIQATVPLGARLFEELLAQLERGERPSTVQAESRATFELRRPPKPEPAT